MKKNNKGFTLVEVIVSIALLTLVCLGFFTVIAASTGSVARSEIYENMTEDYVELYNRKYSETHDGEAKYSKADWGTVDVVVGDGKNYITGASVPDVTITLKQKNMTVGDAQTLKKNTPSDPDELPTPMDTQPALVRGTRYAAGGLKFVE
ncbi:MAG: prepilin-type N-terminal cleavage/methylation domain-containing protein [Firmicutes bacterium]|nr:prepilin-type N-terminal cleavage/methylation domain-containing protein [Bacillota bacterium]